MQLVKTVKKAGMLYRYVSMMEHSELEDTLRALVNELREYIRSSTNARHQYHTVCRLLHVPRTLIHYGYRDEFRSRNGL